MESRPIRTEADYKAALKEVSRLPHHAHIVQIAGKATGSRTSEKQEI